MSAHPYKSLPSEAFWRKAMAETPPGEVDPVVSSAFKIARGDRVATAGSCFAQHIARHLARSGFNYYVTETAHPLLSAEMAEAMQYGSYTARYGNVYTARQLAQLFDRAFGLFHPAEPPWQRTDGRWVDPFRPQIQPDGFGTAAEVTADSAYHLRCVRKAFETLDVFVFTLGLTEAWLSRADGSVFPVCPGVAGGTFDADRYEFKNFRAAEITQDLILFAERLRRVNPAAKILVTVSPVPLIATAAGQHVLVSTTYSKAALRVACEEFVQSVPEAAYFPSFEVITGNHARGAYFAQDLRSVTEDGVRHVMRLFLEHYADTAPPASGTAPSDGEVAHRARSERHLADVKEIVRVICDEEALDPAQAEPAG